MGHLAPDRFARRALLRRELISVPVAPSELSLLIETLTAKALRAAEDPEQVDFADFFSAASPIAGCFATTACMTGRGAATSSCAGAATGTHTYCPTRWCHDRRRARSVPPRRRAAVLDRLAQGGAEARRAMNGSVSARSTPRSHASFTVFSDGHYHCFGCNAHGTVFDFIMADRARRFPRGEGRAWPSSEASRHRSRRSGRQGRSTTTRLAANRAAARRCAEADRAADCNATCCTNTAPPTTGCCATSAASRRRTASAS